MNITKVWLDESENNCTMCGLCEHICPEVFLVPEKMVVVDNPRLDLVDEIMEAVDKCPVNVIKVEQVRNQDNEEG